MNSNLCFLKFLSFNQVLNESKILCGPVILSALKIGFFLASKKFSTLEVSIPIT